MKTKNLPDALLVLFARLALLYPQHVRGRAEQGHGQQTPDALSERPETGQGRVLFNSQQQLGQCCSELPHESRALHLWLEARGEHMLHGVQPAVPQPSKTGWQDVGAVERGKPMSMRLRRWPRHVAAHNHQRRVYPLPGRVAEFLEVIGNEILIQPRGDATNRLVQGACGRSCVRHPGRPAAHC